MTQEKRRQMYSIVHYIAEFMDSQRTTSARTINIWRKSTLLSWKKKEFISNVPTFKPKHWQFIIKKQLRVYDIKHYMSTYCWPKLSIQCKSLCFFLRPQVIHWYFYYHDILSVLAYYIESMTLLVFFPLSMVATFILSILNKHKT